jgi:hypothetical protein
VLYGVDGGPDGTCRVSVSCEKSGGEGTGTSKFVRHGHDGVDFRSVSLNDGFELEICNIERGGRCSGEQLLWLLYM